MGLSDTRVPQYAMVSQYSAIKMLHAQTLGASQMFRTKIHRSWRTSPNTSNGSLQGNYLGYKLAHNTHKYYSYSISTLFNPTLFTKLFAPTYLYKSF